MRYQAFEYRLIPAGAEITGYYGNEGEVTFPAEIEGHKVVALGRCAFVMQQHLTCVTIPDSVEEIGFGAFEGCLQLVSCRLPQGLKKLGFRAFARCERLEEAILPEGLTVIEEGAYNGCTSLSSLRLPGSLRIIGRNAFLGCNGLKEILVPEGVERIEAQAFSGCGSALTLSLPQSLKEIGSDAFQGCGRLEDIRLPEAFRAHVRDLRVGYGLMVQDGLTVVGSFTYMMHQGKAILEDYEGPGVELVIPSVIEGHPVGGLSHMLFLNLAGLERVSLPASLVSVKDVVPQGVAVTFR